MAIRRSIIRTSVAVGVLLSVGGLSIVQDVHAQGRGAAAGQGQAPAGGQGRGGRGGGGAQYTPAAGAKDLKSVLFNWAWYMGMLRSSNEMDLLMSLEYEGKGTMQVDGQPCNVTKYRTSISYQTSGERIQITGTRPNGQS